jgi:hypothetical protein
MERMTLIGRHRWLRASLVPAVVIPVLLVLALGPLSGSGPQAQSKGADPAIPEMLSQTGLYADIGNQVIAADHLPYTPQYPLWSDGAGKRRWIHLPRGTAIDASDPEHWVFPLGTRLFKEFRFGTRIETRLLQRNQDGSWSFVTYLWQDDGQDARLAPETGHPGWRQIQPGVAWDIPGRWDCLACHESEEEPVLGFNALQLSPERDPLAPNATTPVGMELEGFIDAGLVVGLDREKMDWPPRMAGATPEERALRGYLRANCSNCHNPTSSLADLGLFLDNASVETLNNPEVRKRMGTRDPNVQMPPLGTRLIDTQALQLLDGWKAKHTQESRKGK